MASLDSPDGIPSLDSPPDAASEEDLEQLLLDVGPSDGHKPAPAPAPAGGGGAGAARRGEQRSTMPQDGPNASAPPRLSPAVLAAPHPSGGEGAGDDEVDQLLQDLDDLECDEL